MHQAEGTASSNGATTDRTSQHTRHRSNKHTNNTQPNKSHRPRVPLHIQKTIMFGGKPIQNTHEESATAGVSMAENDTDIEHITELPNAQYDDGTIIEPIAYEVPQWGLDEREYRSHAPRCGR